MKRFYLIITILFVGVSALWSQHANVIWNTPSHNSSESMPCGGGDIGMNIWVEDGDVMFYVSRSGTFDEKNCQLKQGRVRLRLSPNPFKDAKDFRQELKLKDGYVEIAAGNTQIQFWVDVFHPIIHVEVTNAQPLQTEVFYENWRYQERPVRKGEGQQCSYKWAPPKGTVTESDFISLDKITDSTGKAETNRTSIKRNQLLFYHRNPEQTVFDVVVAQQGMNEVKSQMMNPLKNLTFGGTLLGTGGLVRAYSAAVQEGLRESLIIEKHLCRKVRMSMDYTMLGKMQYLAAKLNLMILDTLYTDGVEMQLLVPDEQFQSFIKEVTEASNGKVAPETEGSCYGADVEGRTEIFDA